MEERLRPEESPSVDDDDEKRRPRRRRRRGALFTPLLLLFSLVTESSACTTDGEVCSESAATVCRNGTCVSACALGGMAECTCDVEEDSYCYLCCGNSHHQCAPAHQHGILRSNGERWEREACTRCRMNSDNEGMPCDDIDANRLCLGGKCSNSVCHNKPQGSNCDRKYLIFCHGLNSLKGHSFLRFHNAATQFRGREEKICVEDRCENPCAREAPHLMVCECEEIDRDTGFASEDRCQLCCYDFNLKPHNRRCRNAARNYNIFTSQKRPIFRVGLKCAGGKTCNRFGVCAAPESFRYGYVFIVLAFGAIAGGAAGLLR